jgi:hypothetical protein
VPTPSEGGTDRHRLLDEAIDTKSRTRSYG